MTTLPVQRFTAAPFECVSAGYSLGNGYRLYLPGLMRFSAPDISSPFDEGGVNAYAYCASNPVSRADPTGHGFFDVLKGVFKVIADVFDYTSPIWLLTNKVIKGTPEWLKTTAGVFQKIAQDAMFTTLAVAAAIPTGGASIGLFASFEIGMALASGGLSVVSDIMGAFKGGGIEKATQIVGYTSAAAGFGAGLTRTAEALTRPIMDVSLAKDATNGLNVATEEGGREAFSYSAKVNWNWMLFRRIQGATGMLTVEGIMNSPTVLLAIAPPPAPAIPKPPIHLLGSVSSLGDHSEASDNRNQNQSRLLIFSPLK
jgi:RHS repeat-associated protein